MVKFTIRQIGKLIVLAIFLLGIILFSFYEKDTCYDLEACEQYKCLNPQFYCAATLYESKIKPVTIKDAEKIVMEYINNKLGLSAKIVSSAGMSEPYKWYQVTAHLSDGSEYGYEVGPDGNIYEIKHLK